MLLDFLQPLDVSKLKGTNSSNHQRLHQIDLVGQDKVVLVDLGKELVDKLLESVVGRLVGKLAHSLEQLEEPVLELELQLVLQQVQLVLRQTLELEELLLVLL